MASDATARGMAANSLVKAKEYADTKVSAIGSGFSYKGSVATIQDLPASATKGDAYNIQTGGTYAWDGSAWYPVTLKGDKGDKGDTGFASEWGNIGGTLANQTDLNTALSGKASASDLSSLSSDVDSIEEKIPSQATAQNQLADKSFVNSSIATNTANYISDNGQPFASVAALEAYSGTVTNNDYAFVTGTDEQGNAYFDRYKATVSGQTITWAKEYRLNNSSFTSAQWSAINSGINSGLVALIQTALQPSVLNSYRTSSDQDVIDAGKVDKVTGKGLSTEDYTSAEKTKLSGIEAGADVTDATNVASAGAEMTSNKTTTVSAQSTDTQYPTSKCLFDSLSGKQAQNVQRTVTIAVADWNSGTTCIKSCSGVTATNTVIVDSSDSSVTATAQGTDELTFTATSTPTGVVTVKVVILP